MKPEFNKRKNFFFGMIGETAIKADIFNAFVFIILVKGQRFRMNDGKNLLFGNFTVISGNRLF